MNQTVNQFSSPFFTCFSRTFLSSSFPLFFVVFFFLLIPKQFPMATELLIAVFLLHCWGTCSSKVFPEPNSEHFLYACWKCQMQGKCIFESSRASCQVNMIFILLREEAEKCIITPDFKYFTLTGWALHGLISRSQLPKMSLFMQFYTMVKTKTREHIGKSSCSPCLGNSRRLMFWEVLLWPIISY